MCIRDRLDAEWDDRGIDGVNRFLKRVWNLVMDSKDADVKASKEMIKERHRLIYDVTTVSYTHLDVYKRQAQSCLLQL